LALIFFGTKKLAQNCARKMLLKFTLGVDAFKQFFILLSISKTNKHELNFSTSSDALSSAEGNP